VLVPADDPRCGIFPKKEQNRDGPKIVKIRRKCEKNVKKMKKNGDTQVI
jgi:hypothetical protein